jgi:hypothetical protein
MKIELQKVESDWQQSSLGCYISLNNSLLDVITPLNNPHVLNTVELNNSGVLRLVIRDMGRTDGYLGSVSLALSLLNSNNSSIVLPLFDSPNGDTLNSLPVSCDLPRLTVGFFNDYSDDEIFLPTNESKTESQVEVFLTKKFSISEENDDFLTKTSNFNTHDEKKVEGLDIFQAEIDGLREELGREKEKHLVFHEKYLELLQKFKENSARSQVRENSLLELLAEKEDSINKNIEINLDLQNQLRNLSFENKLMAGKVEKYEKQEEYVKQLESELKKYQDLLKTAEKAKDELTSTLIKFSQSDYSEQTTPIKDSPCFISTPRILTERNFISDKSPARHTEDLIRAQILKSLPKSLTSPKIRKIKDFLYSVNDVPVYLALCDSGLFVQSNSNLIPIEKYLETLTKSRSKFLNENEVKSKGFLRSTESSLNRLKVQSFSSSRSSKGLRSELMTQKINKKLRCSTAIDD